MLEHRDPYPHPFGPINVNVAWAAMICNLSVGHLRRLCREGRIEGAHRRHGRGNWQIPLASLDRSLVGSMRWHMNRVTLADLAS
jgi:hypothetical protein